MAQRRISGAMVAVVALTSLLACWLVSLTAQSASAQGNAERVAVLIAFDKTPGADQRAAVRRLGGRIRHSFHLVPAIAASVPESAIAGLSRMRGVKAIEPDGTFQAHDAELDNTWGVNRIGAGAVHAAGNTGVGVKVAVIDSGVDYNHPELAAAYAGGFDFVNNDSDPLDDNGHGTHVAGTVAAADDDVGVVGVAPGVQLYALKVLGASGSGSFGNVIAALQWCVDHGIQVTNNSYGSSTNPGGIVQAAFDAAEAAGIVNVASAGNTGNPKGKGNKVGYPARYASVVAVAAVDMSDQRASFSSTGDTVELSGPGVTINSALLGGGYTTASGTSMASPHVAGTAALVIAAGITTVDDVRAAMALSAEDLGDTGLDPLYGWGLVNAAAAVGVTPPPPDDPPPPPPPGGLVLVDSISYTTQGGKNSDKHLSVTVAVVDELGNPVGGASVSVLLMHESGSSWPGTATTGGSGEVTFTLKNAPAGVYSTDVTDVTAAGFTWDGLTPPNSFAK